MLYRAIKLWTDPDGRGWLSYQGHNPSDTAMGPLSTTGTKFGDQKAADDVIAWARMHKLEIIDNRAA